MKKTLALLSLCLVGLIAGCATTLQPLEEKKGTVYSETFVAPRDLTFKVAKSVAFRSHCAMGETIYEDDLNFKLYSIFRLYGMFPEYIWLVSVEPVSDTTTKVEISYTPYIVSEGCFKKEFFDGIKSSLKTADQ